jgi:hypothetical protein
MFFVGISEILKNFRGHRIFKSLSGFQEFLGVCGSFRNFQKFFTVS